MDITSVLGIAALVASFVALAASTTIALRQARTAYQANQVPVLVDLIKDLVSSVSYQRELSLYDELPKHDPALGFSGLPEPLRSNAYEITTTYLMISYLVLLDILDERLAILPVHYRVLRVWNAVEPFVRGERAIRGDPNSFMNVLEAFVAKVGRADIPTAVKRVNRRFGFTRRAVQAKPIINRPMHPPLNDQTE
jgi:hypothetical protein